MFGIFKVKSQKSYLAMQIESKGVDHVATETAVRLTQHLSESKYISHFILAELDGASMGNEKSKKFVRESGVPEDAYKGQHQFEHPLIDGPDGAKILMDAACLEIIDQQDLVVEFRLMTLDKMMRQFKFGKYDSAKEQSADCTATLINSKGQTAPVTGRVIEQDSRSLDSPEFREKLKVFHSMLRELSERPTQKTFRIRITPCDGSFWSWEFNLSDDEEESADMILSQLFDFAQGWVTTTSSPIRVD